VSQTLDDAFDANVLTYIARNDPRGASAKAVLTEDFEIGSCIGSTLLISETLGHAMCHDRASELRKLQELLARIDLRPVDYETADLSAALAAKYGLRPIDSVQLATAVLWGAERFHTSNSKDFGQYFDEIEIVLPQP
jgi:predicted nucleic acid-binding protein